MSSKAKKRMKNLALYVAIPAVLTVIMVFIGAGMMPVGADPYGGWRGWPAAWWHFQTFQMSYPIPVTAYETFNMAGLVEDIVIFYILFAGLVYLWRKLFK